MELLSVLNRWTQINMGMNFLPENNTVPGPRTNTPRFYRHTLVPAAAPIISQE